METTKDVFKFLKAIFEVSNVDTSKVFMAGGCLRAKDYFSPKDIDLFFEDSATRIKVSEVLKKFGSKEKVTTANADTLEVPSVTPHIQLIKIIEGKAEDVVKQFDFTINQNYIYFNKEVEDVKFHSCNLLIVSDRPKTPNTLLQRLLKFLKKGYSIENKEFKKLLSMVQESVTKEYVNYKDVASMYDDI